jgi:hypothetical protein
MAPVLQDVLDMVLSAKANAETLSRLIDCGFGPDASHSGRHDKGQIMAV